MSWKPFDLEHLPNKNDLVRIRDGGLMCSGVECRFICIADRIKSRSYPKWLSCDGMPWVIAAPLDGRPPGLIYGTKAVDVWVDD